MITRPPNSAFAPRLLLGCLLAFTLTSCETAKNLVYEPSPTDPLDGFEGSLSEVGINTEVDWGPKQSRLLSEYKTLLESRARLEEEHKRLQAENQNLHSQLSGESTSLQKQRGMRAQAEAETERLRKALRERDAKILSLSLEKAKLEQDRLRSQIADLDEAMQTMNPQATEASSSRPTTPPRRP